MIKHYSYFILKESETFLVAKFTLGALAIGDYWFGRRTKNPWNLNVGSSTCCFGFSKTVARLVKFSIGTEFWVNIVSPATTFDARVLRPPFGSISKSGDIH